MTVKGKVALVTGASQGLGKAFAEALLKGGAKVCLADIQVEVGETTASNFQREYGEDRVFFAKCDVAQEKDLEDTFSAVKRKYGRLDIVVNNAGIGGEGNWSQMIDINLKGVIKGTQLAIETMRKDGGGTGGLVINVGSTAGLTPVYFEPCYAASKYGVVGFTRSWADNPHLDDFGLRFACICPAFTDTGILQVVSDVPEDVKQLMQNVGINKVETVVDAFMQLVEDENNNGTIATITALHGIRFKRRQGSSPKTSKL